VTRPTGGSPILYTILNGVQPLFMPPPPPFHPHVVGHGGLHLCGERENKKRDTRREEIERTSVGTKLSVKRTDRRKE